MAPSKDPDEWEASQSLSSYIKLLREYPGWRILWIGEILSNLGNWFSYVATLVLVEDLAAGHGIYISLVLLMRYIPSFVFFPVAGSFADRYERVGILVWSNLVSAVAVAALTLITRAQELWLLYALLFAGFAASAFYDPARRALTPSLVPRGMLHLATTLDSFAWSLTGAVGASLGGLAASRISRGACFWLDAATYGVSAACAWRLRAMRLEAAAGGLPSPPKGQAPEQWAGKELELQAGREAAAAAAAAEPPTGDSQAFISAGLSSRQAHAPAQGAEDAGDEAGESAALLPGKEAGAQPAAGASGGGCGLILGSMRQELAAMREGWAYVSCPSNRDVLPLALLKACGSLVWAAADVLNVEFSQLPQMQGAGDAAFTLGLLYASVGFACFVGPLISNCFTPPRPPHLLLASAACFLFLMLGYLGIAAAGNVWLLCGAIVAKSLGSAVMWVYSTLLLQLRVPDALLGRILALEMACFTVAECASGLFGGVAIDELGLSLRQVSLLMAALAGLVSAVWVPYAIRRFLRAAPQQAVASP